MSHDTEATSSKRKLRKYGSAIDTSSAFETNDLNLTTANCCYSDLAKSESTTEISQH
jgi:hypothetical protein